MKTGNSLLWLALLLFTLAPGRPLWAAAPAVPQLSARVTDTAGMLSPATEQQLESVLAQLEREESTQLAVLTIPSLAGENLEEYSLKVAESWGLGRRDRDNGALLLIVKNERKLRIEVGYGLEGRLTDLVAGRIIRDIIAPRFRDGNFDQGVIDGVAAMIAAVRGEFRSGDPAGSAPPQAADDLSGMVVVFAFAFFMLGRILRKHRLAAASLGAVVAPGLGLLFLGFSWLILLLIPGGLLAGFLASLIFGSMPLSAGRPYIGGSFGRGGGFGGGGFSGGGGGFGGGGSSGGW